MFTCGRYMTANQRKYWNYSSVKRLLFTIVLLTTSIEINASNINFTESGSGQEINCTVYRSCTKCADISICSWAIQKQICLYSNQSLSENHGVVTKESCPKYAVTLKTEDKHYQIQVTVLNITVESVRNFFNKNAVISCEIENKIYNASIDNEVITCKKNIISPAKQISDKINPLFILYFSIIVNGVRLQFDDPRDHYVSYRSRTCPNVNCSIVFWESDSKKYYCKWCLKNDSCQTTADPRSNCDVRDAINNEKWNNDDTALSAIEVKSPELAIESFNPDVLIFIRKMPAAVNITVKNHELLADGSRLKTVTVAGQSCENATMVDDQTINCIVSPYAQNIVEGPVLVEYEWVTASTVTLRSTQKFKFVKPRFTGVSPTCVPASGGTRIELTGENLNATTFVQVFFKKTKTKPMCEIVELFSDRISCTTVANDRDQKPGLLRIEFEGMMEFYCRENLFSYVDDPIVQDGQVFAGIASGDVPLIVQGVFNCTENQRMYVDDYNGTRRYGRCALRTINGTAAMHCRPPKFDSPAQTMSLPLGFSVELAGKVVDFQRQPPYSYMLHPDPVYADFEVRDVDVIRVNGWFPDPLQRRRSDGNYLLEVVALQHGEHLDDDDDHTCALTYVTDDHFECRSLSGKSLVDTLEIEIALGEQTKRTVVRRRHDRHYTIVRLLRPQYVVGGISLLLICVFALIVGAKKIMNRSKRHVDRRYLGELRNITAGIDESNHYLINSNTGR
ncbi:plexin-A3-like [Melanaphis sacchari]|uniref:Plexin-A3 n=1 Tax=Melanaphis sacchari TaxID=742174 RepID=A0A2H8TV27_9HEMI|nr:plexin-A3-like [Melanaphis sacchari]